MAIAGLVVMGLAEHMAHIRTLLEREPDVVEVQPTEDATRLAAVLETGSDKVEAAMARILTWEGILTVDLAYVSYEDDLEAGGISCPPHNIPRNATQFPIASHFERGRAQRVLHHADKPRKMREASE